MFFIAAELMYIFAEREAEGVEFKERINNIKNRDDFSVLLHYC